MVDATIKDMYACTAKTRKDLIGQRVSITDLEVRPFSTVPGVVQYSGTISCIVKRRPKSRIKEYMYEGFLLSRVVLEDIDYGLDYEID